VQAVREHAAAQLLRERPFLHEKPEHREPQSRGEQRLWKKAALTWVSPILLARRAAK